MTIFNFIESKVLRWWCDNFYLYVLLFFQEIPVKQMKSHIVEAHKMQDYKFRCNLCPKRFDKKSAIKKHYRHVYKDSMYLGVTVTFLLYLRRF